MSSMLFQSTGTTGTTASAGDQAVKTIHHAIDALEAERQDLAHLYARAEGGSVVEHEIGECLTQVRKSLVRLRKAYGELAQMSLPLDEG